MEFLRFCWLLFVFGHVSSRGTNPNRPNKTLQEFLSEIPHNVTEPNLFNKFSIGALPNDTFIDFAECLQINLQINGITHIEVNSFRGLAKLKVFNLGGNSDLQIPDNAFISLPQCEEMYLKENEIRTINQWTFRGLYNLIISYACQ